MKTFQATQPEVSSAFRTFSAALKAFALWLRFLCPAVLSLVAQSTSSAQTGFTGAEADGIRSFLQQNFANTNAGMVIGLIDERGTRILSAGKPDNGSGQEVNGDTLFEIGSVTKTFTALLALDMAARGELTLDDPAAKYLPKSVKMPRWNDKPITILNLAAQDSGLPFNADNLSGKDWAEKLDTYTVERMYAFLSGYALTNEPGARFQYSNLGMSLLGHVMELNSGTNFESLIVNRICHPLQMESTCITLTPGLSARLATGHDENGRRAPNYHLQVMAGAGALLSTANDLVKYVSANLGLTESSLTQLMKKTQVIRHRNAPEFGNTAMPWWDGRVYQPPGMELIGHGGGTHGYSAFIGFDKRQRRGVVVLANQKVALANTYPIGWHILQRAPLKGMEISSVVAMQEFVGTGIALDLDKETHALWITKVFPNTPASQAGMSAGLVIQRINGIATAGKSLAECMQLSPGGVGAKVRMELVNLERKQTNTVEVAKQRFLVSSK